MQVDAGAPERNALVLEQAPLTLSFGQRAVRPHDAVPGKPGLVAGGQNRAGVARGARLQVAVGPHEALGHFPHPLEHAAGAGIIEVHAGNDMGRSAAAEGRTR